MKRLRLAALLLVIIAVAAALLLVDPFDWELSPIRRTTVSARESLLREVRAVYRINTMELVYKSVFPYDFLPRDPDWRMLFYAAEVRELTPEETELLAFYRFCRELGIDLTARDPGFAVVTLVARAGFDFEGFPLAERFSIDGTTLTIGLPEPRVTELTIQDSAGDDYPYPGMEISPENWKRLTEYVTARFDPVLRESRLLEQARARGEELFRRLAESRGYEEVRFSYRE